MDKVYVSVKFWFAKKQFDQNVTQYIEKRLWNWGREYRSFVNTYFEGELIEEREKAILIRPLGMKPIWIPRSVCTIKTQIQVDAEEHDEREKQIIAEIKRDIEFEREMERTHDEGLQDDQLAEMR